MVTNGITIPDHLRLPQTRSPVAEISFIDFPDGSQSLHATMPTFQEFRQHQQHDDDKPELDGASPDMTHAQTVTSTTSDTTDVERSYSGRIETLNISQRFREMNSSTAYSSPNTMTSHNQLGDAQFSRRDGGGLDTAQNAVDFVLALEKPCLAHHPADFDNLNADSNGHCLMLQAPLLSRQPNRSQSNPTNSQAAAATQSGWNVTVIEIEKLLNLSDRLSLDGELTPVEAWQRIRRHPGFPYMTTEQLETLRDVLLSNVKCYG